MIMDTSSTRLLRAGLRVLERETVRPFDSQADCCGLTLPQCHTLIEVGTRNKVSLVDLAASFGLDASTLSRTIQGLVEIGLIDRKTSPEDRRYVVISLTPQGRRVFREIEDRFNRYYDAVMDRVPAGRREAIVAAVTELADAVWKHNEESGCCRGRK